MNRPLLRVALLFGGLTAAAMSTPAAANEFKFETVGPTSGTTLTVRLLDETSGSTVTDAHVFAIHRRWLPVKGVPRFIDERIPLKPDDRGDFVYDSNDVQSGATIRLVAQVVHNETEIAGSVCVCG
jgi:hypothetical protein